MLKKPETVPPIYSVMPMRDGILPFSNLACRVLQAIPLDLDFFLHHPVEVVEAQITSRSLWEHFLHVALVQVGSWEPSKATSHDSETTHDMVVLKACPLRRQQGWA